MLGLDVAPSELIHAGHVPCSRICIADKVVVFSSDFVYRNQDGKNNQTHGDKDLQEHTEVS